MIINYQLILLLNYDLLIQMSISLEYMGMSMTMNATIKNGHDLKIGR